MSQQNDTEHMIDVLDACSRTMSFDPLLGGIRLLLEENGVPFDRIQLPMTKPLGFRHPTLYGVLLTWTRRSDATEKELFTHERAQALDLPLARSSEDILSNTDVPRSPYSFVQGRRDWLFTCELSNPKHDFKVFHEMRADGHKHYACLRLRIPATAIPGVMSIASNQPFPIDLRQRLDSIRGLLSITCYAACRTSQAYEIASCYVGRNTGPKVLEGNIIRGASERIQAGIMFCDVRGFTALSETLGQGIICIMNELFESVGAQAEVRGGEILKFIGDAMLLIFRPKDEAYCAVAKAMVDTVKAAKTGIAQVAVRHGYDVSIGFGCHIGEVIYGNIGTPTRLDFTVMGPAVNLTSRLESLCKPLGVTAVFSQSIQKHHPHLKPAGEHTLKGISSPTPVWVLD